MSTLSPWPEWASTTSALCISALVCPDPSCHAGCLLDRAFTAFQLVHQIFRRFETFNLSFHAFLLLVPPIIAPHYISSPGWIGWPTVSELVFCYAVYLGTLTTSVVFYRLSPFHPLYRFPGPVWCRMSMIWHAVRTSDGKQMVYLRSLHDTYGDIVRIGEFSVARNPRYPKLYDVDPFLLNSIRPEPPLDSRCLAGRTYPRRARCTKGS